MATWTAYTQAGLYAGSSDSHSTSYSDTATSPQQSVSGYNPSGYAGTGSRQNPPALTGMEDSVMYASSSSWGELDSSLLTGELGPFSPTVRFDHDGYVSTGLRSSNGPYTSDVEGHMYANASGTTESGVGSRLGLWFDHEPANYGYLEEDEMESLRYVSIGSVIPTAYFRRVRGVVTDKQGNVIRNARYVVSLDNFGIVGQVDDNGVFDIYLLRQTYSDFMIVVDEGKKEGVDIVWYESEGTEVSIYDDSKQLTFDTSQTLSGGGGGLQVGGGVHLG